MRYASGDFFGERALIKSEPRAANVIAKTKCVVVSLDRHSVKRLLGPVEELLKRNFELYEKFKWLSKPSINSVNYLLFFTRRGRKYSCRMLERSVHHSASFPIRGQMSIGQSWFEVLQINCFFQQICLFLAFLSSPPILSASHLAQNLSFEQYSRC